MKGFGNEGLDVRCQNQDCLHTSHPLGGGSQCGKNEPESDGSALYVTEYPPNEYLPKTGQPRRMYGHTYQTESQSE